MTTILIAVGVLLIIVILVMIFRVASLITLVKGAPQSRENSGNKINAILWPIFLVIGSVAAIWSSVAAADYFLPEPASLHGIEIDDMFWVTNGIIAAVFFATHIVLFWFPFKYQFRENRRASFYPDNNKLEVIWTVIPAIVLTLLVLSGWKVWRDITQAPPEEAFPIELVGKQFNWLIRYPGSRYADLGTRGPELGDYDFRLIDADNELGIDFTDNNALDDFLIREIHLPKGRPVVLKIRGRDVLHSVFLPHFRLKMDAVPGMPTKFWFVPTKTTKEMRAELNDPDFNYELACTEVCGRGHFSMRSIVIVEEPEEFNAWLNKQKPWLASHREYLSRIPANLQEKALRIIGPAEEGEAAPPAEPDATPAIDVTDAAVVPTPVPAGKAKLVSTQKTTGQ